MWVGGLRSLLELGEVVVLPSGEAIEARRLGPFLTVAGALTLFPDGSAMAPRLSAFTTVGGRTRSLVCETGSACSGSTSETDLPVRVTAATFDLLFIPVPVRPPQRAYLILGAGARGYAFQGTASPGLTFSDRHGRRWGPAVVFGAGLRLSASRVGMVLELTDYVAMLEEPGNGMTHDLLLRLSLSSGLAPAEW